MISRKIRKILSATVACCAVGASGVSSADDSGAGDTILFAGYDVREKSHYPYVGVIHHFSGDLLASGFLFRAFAYQADYEYEIEATNQDIDGRADGADVMLGYQWAMEDYSIRAYLGLDYEDHDLDPDNVFDSNRGSDTGVKGQFEYETDYASPSYTSLIASYGTAKDRYWSRLRVGREFSGYVVGPEAVLTGDDEYDEKRIGLFVTARKFLPVSFSISGGYSDSGDERADSSAYLNLEISRTF